VAVGDEPPALPPMWLLKVASVFQSGVLITFAVVVGMWLSPKVGLHSPAAEAASRGEAFLPKFKPQILPGVLAGLATGVALVGTWVVAKPSFSAEFISRAEEFNRLMPNITRFLYGGFAEEILLRWGMMTFLVWASWRLFQKDKERPKSVYFVGAILLSALIFGAGHLPIASMLGGGLTLPIVAYVITANSIFGIAAGFLYWRRGLEAAIIAHITAHVVLVSAIYLAF